MSKVLAQPCAQLALLVAMVAPVALAGDIYRWTDEQGRTHLSDQVPDAYRDKASRTNSRDFELTPQERAEAARRLAREREDEEWARTKAKDRELEADRAATAKRPTRNGAGQPAREEGECEKRWREYLASLKCFEPFILPRGGLNGEAFKHCVSRTDPSKECGPVPTSTLRKD
jgi:hypothetical protein